jgi:hypothetical protein
MTAPASGAGPGRPGRAATAGDAVRLIAGGCPRVVLVVPGWLGRSGLRNPVLQKLRGAVGAQRAAPVHSRWIWLREDEDGASWTGFLVWPCTAVHAPGFQCLDGQVLRRAAR